MSVSRSFRMSKKAIAISAIIMAISLTTCKDMLTGSDVKERISEDVVAANAASQDISVVPEDVNMGTTDPSGTKTIKIGISFDITANALAAYVFSYWEQTGGNGEVTFTDAMASTTKAVVSKAVSGITITAHYVARPKVLSKTPGSEATSVLRNTDIVVNFSKAMNPDTLSFDTVGVEMEAKTDEGSTELQSLTSKLSLIKSSDYKTITLRLKDGETSFDGQTTIHVTVLKDVKDSAGHSMAEDYTWYFKTGSNEDNGPPVVNEYSLKSGTSAIASGTRLTSRSLTLAISASDDSGNVDTVRITEYAAKDIDGNAMTETIVNDVVDYASLIPYTLKTSGDGLKKIAIEVGDAMGNLQRDTRRDDDVRHRRHHGPESLVDHGSCIHEYRRREAHPSRFRRQPGRRGLGDLGTVLRRRQRHMDRLGELPELDERGGSDRQRGARDQGALQGRPGQYHRRRQHRDGRIRHTR